MAKNDKSSKTQVLDSRSGSRMPYLRGILTRSLQASGLQFNDAYKLATWVRRELDDRDEITSDALREMVAKRLDERHGEAARDYYMQPEESTPTILVRDTQKQTSPFTTGRLTRSLEAASLSLDQAEAVSGRIQLQVQRMALKEISSDQVTQLVHHDLMTHLGEVVARKYLVWLEFLRSGRPLVLLIGGINGVGKSSLAAELAHRLEIVRTQSTDMLREVMRQMTAKKLLPSIHTSSFSAWHQLPSGYRSTIDEEDLMVDGFLTQSEQVGVAVDAVLQRALSERVAMIIEGIHIHPAYMAELPEERDAIVVPFMLATVDQEQLKKQLRGRAVESPSRRADRYLKNFEVIWTLQSYLLSEADRYHLPIFSEKTTEAAAREVLDLIHNRLARHFEGKRPRRFEAAS